MNKPEIIKCEAVRMTNKEITDMKIKYEDPFPYGSLGFCENHYMDAFFYVTRTRRHYA